MFGRWIAVVASLFAANVAQAQDSFVVEPLLENITAEEIVAKVIAREREEAQSGPAYLIVRERIEGVAATPTFSVLKRIGGLGYFHLPPLAIEHEWNEPSDNPANDGFSSFGDLATKYQTLAWYTLGLALVLDVHVPGTGPIVTKEGEKILKSMKEADLEALRISANADDAMRARLSALRQFVETAEVAGTTNVWGHDAWYLISAGSGTTVPMSSSPDGDNSQGVTGNMVVDRMEVWVSRNLSRIVGIRFTGHGADGGGINFNSPDDALADFTQSGSESHPKPTGETLPISAVTVQQTREDFAPVDGTSVMMPLRKTSFFEMFGAEEAIMQSKAVRFVEEAGARHDELRQDLLAAARARQGDDVPNEDLILLDEEKRIWKEYRTWYTSVVVPVQKALQALLRGMGGGVTTVVECIVPASSPEELRSVLGQVSFNNAETIFEEHCDFGSK